MSVRIPTEKLIEDLKEQILLKGSMLSKKEFNDNKNLPCYKTYLTRFSKKAKEKDIGLFEYLSHICEIEYNGLVYRTKERLIKELKIELIERNTMFSGEELDNNKKLANYRVYNQRFKEDVKDLNIGQLQFLAEKCGVEYIQNKKRGIDTLLKEIDIEAKKKGSMLSENEINNNKLLASYSYYNNSFKEIAADNNMGTLQYLTNILNYNKHEYIRNKLSDSSLIKELSVEAKLLGRMLSKNEIESNDHLSSYYIYTTAFSIRAKENNMGLLEYLSSLCNIQYIGPKYKTDDRLLEELKIVVDIKGSMITQEEFKENVNLSDYATYWNRFNNKSDGKLLMYLAKECKVEYTDEKVSIWELEVRKFIENNTNTNIVYNDRKTINPFELDIYIPELKLAVECNGEYWHSKKYKDETYHLHKTTQCENKDIVLIHIFSNEWENKKDSIKEYLLDMLVGKTNKLKCETKEVDRMKPIKYYNAEILSYTNPKIIKVGKYDAWDCGNIIFGRIKGEL